MNRFVSFFAIVIAIASPFGVAAQDSGTPIVRPTSVPVKSPVPAQSPKSSEVISTPAETVSQNPETQRERREQALAKLLEGQRYVWAVKRSRAQANANGKLAKQAFQKAVELDPTLAEAYTALAELSWNLPPNDLEEAIRFATIAVKIDEKNFGGHRILARGFTIKSKLNRGTLDRDFADRAIGSWKRIAQLDPRNAEAWAFLAELYKDQPDNRIAALRSWLSSAQPVETFFYRTLMGGQADLAPEAAAVRLGGALLDAKRYAEAIEVLNQVIADEPGDTEAVDLLSRAIDSADPKTAATSVQAIQQAIYANPGNTQLILLLARVQSRAGKIAEAEKFIGDTVARLAAQDKAAAAGLQVGLGDVYRDSERFDEAAAEYFKSFKTRGVSLETEAGDEDRDFAIIVFERVVEAYKLANRIDDARKVIISSQKVLGDEDSFTDRQLVALFRETGRRAEALQTVKFARMKFPDDYGFLRSEASVLTELGRVDEGVAIVKTLLGKQNPESPSIMFDDFSNYLFISILYAEAKRGKDAIAAANQALGVAGDEERKQIAQMTLATGQNIAGDFAAAEATLRGILKVSPRNPIALNNLGYFLIERNERLDEAVKLVQQAIEIDPENPSYLDSLGWGYFKTGKLDLAEQNLKKALKIDPFSATMLDHLGDVYQKQGNIELAKQFWQRALNYAADAELIAQLKQKLAGKKSK